MTKTKRLFGIAALTVLTANTAPALAQVEEGRHEVTVYGGELFGDDLTDIKVSGRTRKLDDADDAEAGAGQAGERASAEAMNLLGILYATGNGVPQDFVAALAWYRRAAENGSTSAMNNIATTYFHGLGVQQSYEEAVKWLRLAVQQGDAAAQNGLGLMYAGGLGVRKSAHDAFELFSLAAARGYAPGMANLGYLYARGSGVKRDDIRAYALISAAIEIGVPDSNSAFYELGARSQRLTAKQLERAQADARTLIERRPQGSSVRKATSASKAERL